MQTFLGDPHFGASLSVLDPKRLGKQRVEGLQILNTLTHTSDGWRYHPAVKMWIGHEEALAQYTELACDIWIARGGNDTILGRVIALRNRLPYTGLPWWFGDPDFHRAHRSNLLRKNPRYYSTFYPPSEVPDDLPYLWPCLECRTFFPKNSCKAHRGDARSGVSPLL